MYICLFTPGLMNEVRHTVLTVAERFEVAYEFDIFIHRRFFGIHRASEHVTAKLQLALSCKIKQALADIMRQSYSKIIYLIIEKQFLILIGNRSLLRYSGLRFSPSGCEERALYTSVCSLTGRKFSRF